MPRRLCTNIIAVGTPARATSAASCSGPEGRRCSFARRSRGSPRRTIAINRGSNSTGSMLPDPVPRHLDVAFSERSARSRRARRASRCASAGGVEMALVERDAALLDDAGDDAGLGGARSRSCRRRRGASGDAVDLRAHLARRRGTRPVRRFIGVLPECAAWPWKRDGVALDAERAEHRAERQIEIEQHRALLDVKLRGRRRRSASSWPLSFTRSKSMPTLAPARRAAGRRHCPRGRAPRPGRDCPEHADEPNRLLAEARALLVGPVHEPHGHRRPCRTARGCAAESRRRRAR